MKLYKIKDFSDSKLLKTTVNQLKATGVRVEHQTELLENILREFVELSMRTDHQTCHNMIEVLDLSFWSSKQILSNEPNMREL